MLQVLLGILCLRLLLRPVPRITKVSFFQSVLSFLDRWKVPGVSYATALSFPFYILEMGILTDGCVFPERRLTTNTSIKLPSPAPITIAHQSTAHSRSRLSRHSYTARGQVQEEDDLDADAEGEEDIGEEDGEEDSTLYCFCHEKSYGDVSDLILFRRRFCKTFEVRQRLADIILCR